MKKSIFYIVAILLVGFSVFWSFYSSNKIAYVNTNVVYDGFKLKKELESKYKTVQLARQNLLDSIKFKMQYLSLKGDKLTSAEQDLFANMQRSYLMKEKEFNEENDLTAQQYSEQIWKQINQYMEEFGKENNYDLILGATGQGNIMFAKEKDDLTKPILEFINHKYSGAK